MTLSTYKENKIIDKWLNGGQIKTIGREEKVCAETVRRCLERNEEKTRYIRNVSNKIDGGKKDVSSRFIAGEVYFSKDNFSNKSVIEKNVKGVDSNHSLGSLPKKDIEKYSSMKPMDIDHISILLEQIVDQESDIKTSLCNQLHFDENGSFNKKLMMQVVQDIKTLQSQLVEVQSELRKMKETKDC